MMMGTLFGSVSGSGTFLVDGGVKQLRPALPHHPAPRGCLSSPCSGRLPTIWFNGSACNRAVSALADPEGCSSQKNMNCIALQNNIGLKDQPVRENVAFPDRSTSPVPPL
jgi:hypothetical protein